jgi:hypothetical protein
VGVSLDMDLPLPHSFDGLPRQRAKVEAACRAASTDADVIGVAVAGSFAAGYADEFSDVDLRLYVSEDAVDAMVGRVPNLAAACGRVVALFSAEHVGIPTLTIVLSDDLVHVDFDVLSAARVAEHNQGLPAVVLWERDGLAGELPGAYELDVAADLRWLEAGSGRGPGTSKRKCCGGNCTKPWTVCSTCVTRCCFGCLRFATRSVRPGGGGPKPW